MNLRQLVLILAIGLTVLFQPGLATLSQASGPQDWEAAPGYEVLVDSSGFEFPVSIDFVQNPGDGPKDPLYYVTEIRGRIKVVTNDRSVHVFADEIEALRPEKELPDLLGEFGLTGLCLDEQEQKLYATTVYFKGELLFNKIMRFSSPGEKLGLTGQKEWEFTEPLASDAASHSHQIGDCFIGQDRKLYVGIGDAHQHYKAQLIRHNPGKLLRINLDGTAPKDNPFYEGQNPSAIQNYVYAYGFRNPFALDEGLNGAIWVAENGQSVDRLLKIARGRNYGWNGNDSSMLINGIVTWPEPIGPSGMVFLNEHPLFPDWNNRLLITAPVKSRIVSVWVDNEIGAMQPPSDILTYKKSMNEEQQFLVPIAAGPDGIYFSGFLPQNDGMTHIMKMVPTEENKQVGEQTLSGEGWYARLGCHACHSISGKGGTAGPALDNLVLRLEDYLKSEEYLVLLDKADKIDMPQFTEWKPARDQLRRLKGREKVEFYIRNHLKNPLFDRPQSQMPNFQLNEQQLDALTGYMMTLESEDRMRQKPALERLAEELKFYLSTHVEVYLAVMLVLGILIGLGIRWIFKLLLRLVRLLVPKTKQT